MKSQNPCCVWLGQKKKLSRKERRKKKYPSSFCENLGVVEVVGVGVDPKLGNNEGAVVVGVLFVWLGVAGLLPKVNGGVVPLFADVEKEGKAAALKVVSFFGSAT